MPRCFKCETGKSHPFCDQGLPNLPVDPSLLKMVWSNGQWVSAVEAADGR